MVVLVLGSGGLLGSVIVRKCLDETLDVVGTYHSEPPDFDISLEQLDVRNGERFRKLVQKHQPSVVINCAALTDVDECERSPEKANTINGEAPESLSQICSRTETTFVQISTDYVFSGDHRSPYNESEAIDPRQVYGESKLKGERNALESNDKTIVLRLSFLYGRRGDTSDLTGFPAWVSNQISTGKVPLVGDQQVTPTRAGNAAEVVLESIRKGSRGIYHVACRTCTTPYDFGKIICNQMNARDVQLQRVEQSSLDRRATRPEYTCLDVNKVERELDRPQPTLEEDIKVLDL